MSSLLSKEASPIHLPTPSPLFRTIPRLSYDGMIETCARRSVAVAVRYHLHPFASGEFDFFHVDLQLSNDATLMLFIEYIAHHSHSARRMFRGSDGGWNSGRTGSERSEVLRRGEICLHIHIVCTR